MKWKRIRCALVVSCVSIGMATDLIEVIYKQIVESFMSRLQPRGVLLGILFPHGCAFRIGYQIEYQHTFLCTNAKTRVLHNSGIQWQMKLVSSVAYVYNKISDKHIGCMHYRVRNIPPPIQDYL